MIKARIETMRQLTRVAIKLAAKAEDAPRSEREAAERAYDNVADQLTDAFGHYSDGRIVFIPLSVLLELLDALTEEQVAEPLTPTMEAEVSEIAALDALVGEAGEARMKKP